MPFTSIRSLSRIGRPCAGPLTWPSARSLSSSAASLSASLLSCVTAFRPGPRLFSAAIRAMYARVSCTDVSSPSSIIRSAVGPSSVSRSSTGSALAGADASSAPASAHNNPAGSFTLDSVLSGAAKLTRPRVSPHWTDGRIRPLPLVEQAERLGSRAGGRRVERLLMPGGGVVREVEEEPAGGGRGVEARPPAEARRRRRPHRSRVQEPLTVSDVQRLAEGELDLAGASVGLGVPRSGNVRVADEADRGLLGGQAGARVGAADELPHRLARAAVPALHALAPRRGPARAQPREVVLAQPLARERDRAL